jgi:hypothetical protein
MLIDQYKTCENTYCSLNIYSDSISPHEISERLEISATQILEKGKTRNSKHKNIINTRNVWILSSENFISSNDIRIHIDWLIDNTYNKIINIRELQNIGCQMNISSYWLSRFGHGGPCLSSIQMKKISDMNLDIWFDVYLGDIINVAQQGDRPEPVPGHDQ